MCIRDSVLRERGDALKTHLLEQRRLPLLRVENLAFQNRHAELLRKIDELLEEETGESQSAEFRGDRAPDVAHLAPRSAGVPMQRGIRDDHRVVNGDQGK